MQLKPLRMKSRVSGNCGEISRRYSGQKERGLLGSPRYKHCCVTMLSRTGHAPETMRKFLRVPSNSSESHKLRLESPMTQLAQSNQMDRLRLPPLRYRHYLWMYRQRTRDPSLNPACQNRHPSFHLRRNNLQALAWLPRSQRSIEDHHLHRTPRDRTLLLH